MAAQAKEPGGSRGGAALSACSPAPPGSVSGGQLTFCPCPNLLLLLPFDFSFLARQSFFSFVLATGKTRGILGFTANWSVMPSGIGRGITSFLGSPFEERI